MTGWTCDPTSVLQAAQVKSQQTGTIRPYEGSWFFTMLGQPSSYGTMRQSGALAVEAERLTLSGMVQTEALPVYGDGDFGEATLRLYDASGGLVNSASAIQLRTHGLTWEPFEVWCDVPLGTASWEVELRGTRDYGSWVNVNFDSVRLVVPEPSTFALLSISAFGLLAYAWRRRRTR
jgi:hypothetical protein